MKAITGIRAIMAVRRVTGRLVRLSGLPSSARAGTYNTVQMASQTSDIASADQIGVVEVRCRIACRLLAAKASFSLAGRPTQGCLAATLVHGVKPATFGSFAARNLFLRSCPLLPCDCPCAKRGAVGLVRLTYFCIPATKKLTDRYSHSRLPWCLVCAVYWSCPRPMI